MRSRDRRYIVLVVPKQPGNSLAYTAVAASQLHSILPLKIILSFRLRSCSRDKSSMIAGRAVLGLALVAAANAGGAQRRFDASVTIFPAAAGTPAIPSACASVSSLSAAQPEATAGSTYTQLRFPAQCPSANLSPKAQKHTSSPRPWPLLA